MFKGFSKLKIGLKLMISVLIVEALSLASGVTVGRNMSTHSEWVILGIVATVIISQYIAYLVAKNIDQTVSVIIEDLSLAAGNLNSISRELIAVLRDVAFCLMTFSLSPGWGKYCFLALLNSLSLIAAPDS